MRKQKLERKEYAACELVAVLWGSKNKAGHAKYCDKLAVVTLEGRPRVYHSTYCPVQLTVAHTCTACACAVARARTIRHNHTAIQVIILPIGLHKMLRALRARCGCRVISSQVWNVERFEHCRKQYVV